MPQQQNPYSRGLIVKLEGEEAKTYTGPKITIGMSTYNPTPFFQAYGHMGNLVHNFHQNPYDPRPLLAMRHLSDQLIQPLHHIRQHPALREAYHPLVHGLAHFMHHSKSLVKMRLKTAHHLARAPKILIPIVLSIGAGSAFTAVQIRNPYLGASGGGAGPYLAPWSITSFRTSNNENGQLSPILITQFLLGGHDFVAAALSGLTYVGTAAPATLGWPAAAFAETARKNWQSVIQPWNVVAVSGDGLGFGSVMTETGLLQTGYFNNGSGTYKDTYSVYANATLCGSPFLNDQWTQTDVFRRSFAPLLLQAPLAMKMARDAMGHIHGAIDEDSSNSAWKGGGEGYDWANKIEGASKQIQDFLDEPGNVGMTDDFYDPGSRFDLTQGARIAP